MWQLHSDHYHVGNPSELHHQIAALLHLLIEPYQYSFDAQIKKPGDADVSLSNAVARDAIRRSCQAKLSYPAVVLTTGLFLRLLTHQKSGSHCPCPIQEAAIMRYQNKIMSLLNIVNEDKLRILLRMPFRLSAS